MRAHYLSDLAVKESYSLDAKGLHHLVHVVRLAKGEELLLLNGAGLRVKTVVEDVTKKALELAYVSHEECGRVFEIDLALGIPKKEALELCLKEATELGFRRIYLIRSDSSQQKIAEAERMQGLLISALEQSNAPYLPEIQKLSWEELTWEDYEEVLLLNSQGKSENRTTRPKGRQLLMVGPEGGFSPRELALFLGKKNLTSLNLPTPILRTPTAVGVGAGYLLHSLLD